MGSLLVLKTYLECEPNNTEEMLIWKFYLINKNVSLY